MTVTAESDNISLVWAARSGCSSGSCEDSLMRTFRFETCVDFLEGLGFAQRIRGDHHIFTRAGVDEILNLQPRSGKAKVYQVKQVRAVILKYRLRS